jgi:hypothetical protein
MTSTSHITVERRNKRTAKETLSGEPGLPDQGCQVKGDYKIYPSKLSVLENS